MLLAYLFLALVAAFLDRDTGILGKFYLFRPASLVLLLWLALAVAALGKLGTRHWLAVRLIALALLAPGFALAAAARIAADLEAQANTEGAELAAFLAAALAQSCGPVVYASVRIALLRRGG